MSHPPVDSDPAERLARAAAQVARVALEILDDLDAQDPKTGAYLVSREEIHQLRAVVAAWERAHHAVQDANACEAPECPGSVIDGECSACHVAYGDPCDGCSQRGYHTPTCPENDERVVE